MSFLIHALVARLFTYTFLVAGIFYLSGRLAKGSVAPETIGCGADLVARFLGNTHRARVNRLP